MRFNLLVIVSRRRTLGARGTSATTVNDTSYYYYAYRDAYDFYLRELCTASRAWFNGARSYRCFSWPTNTKGKSDKYQSPSTMQMNVLSPSSKIYEYACAIDNASDGKKEISTIADYTCITSCSFCHRVIAYLLLTETAWWIEIEMSKCVRIVFSNLIKRM